MLNPDFAPAEPPTNLLIAGHKCGIQIHCSPQAKQAYDEIAALSRKGNHWARLTIKGIASLSSGRASMDNVFTKEDNGVAYGRGAFYVSLPGVFASFESLGDSSFKLISLQADTSYFEHQKNYTKPGLWRVERNSDSNSWDAKNVKSGRLLPKHEKRHVAITDRGYADPQKAAESAASGLSSVNDSIRRTIEDDGFDLHFTPGEQKIAGFKNCKEAMNPETAESLQESSQILAYTMYQARDVKSVTWYSDWGGSGVLTQAMRNINDQNVTLDKHCIIMNHPTTRPGHAEALARKLKLDPISGGQKGIKLDELYGRLFMLDTPISAIQRMRHDEKYTVTDLAVDGGKSIFSAGNVATGAIGALGTAGLIAATSPLVVAGGIAGAAYFVSSIALKYFNGRRR